MTGLFSRGNQGTKCSKCGTDLHDKERLKRHQEKAHGDKTSKCSKCGSVFYDSEELRKHRKKCR